MSNVNKPETCQNPFKCNNPIYETKNGDLPPTRYPRSFPDGDKLLCEKCTKTHRVGASSIRQPGISSFSTKELEDELNKRNPLPTNGKPFDPWKK